MKAYVQFLTTDTTGKIVDMLGSDGIFILDGRNKLVTWCIDARKQMKRLRHVKQHYVGFRIMEGDLRSAVEIYQELRMLPETLKALEGSICKWNDICMGHGEELGYENCPLCTLFYFPHECYGCPISTALGMTHCEGTPYVQWERVWTRHYPEYTSIPLEQLRDPEFKGIIAEIAESEVIYLLGLLPEGHKWREMI